MSDKLPHPKRKRDFNQLAKQIVNVAVGAEEESYAPIRAIDPQAVRRGRARAEKLSPERRAEIGKKGAVTRWAKEKTKKRRK